MSGHRYNTKVGYAPAPRTPQSAIETMQTVNLRQFEPGVAVEPGAVVVNSSAPVSAPGATASVFTSVYVRDLDSVADAALLATLAAASSFTIGGPSSGEDVELVYGTGPDRFRWPADLSDGVTALKLFIFGIGWILWLPGGNPWCCENNSASDPESVLLVTKPVGMPLQESDGLSVGRILLEIHGPLL